jgi:hypothetical protein
MGLLLRWLFAFLLVAATYNPTPWNYVRWVADNFAGQMPLALLFGLLLFLGYVIFVTATLRAIGVFGMVLVLAILAALLWVLWDWGLLDLANTSLNVWLAVIALSFVLGLGMTWAILWRRLSGQLEVDDTDR